MLQQILIRNYALIETLDIELNRGLNVITGETGAGKSIIIDAISLLLGQRGNKDNIRSGADKMSVQGVFCITENDDVLNFLQEKGIQADDDTLIITRTIDRNGKNTCRINDTLVTVGTLKALGDHLIDIHSQHEHNRLFTEAAHRELLDARGGTVVASLLQKTGETAAGLKALRQQIMDAERDNKALADQKERLTQAVQEISGANLSPDEDKALEEKIKVLANAEALHTAANGAYQLINGEDESLSGILSAIAALSDTLKSLTAMDDKLKPFLNTCENITVELKNMGAELSDYRDALDMEPGALDQAENRLAEIKALKRRYGDTLEEVIAYGQDAEKRLTRLSDSDSYKTQLKKEYLALWDDYKQTAHELNGQRRIIGEQLSADLETELKDLAMEKAIVQVHIDCDENRISPTGQDHVAFLIAVNPGNPPKPIKAVASGGEISRIMLALKSIFAEADPDVTMIFDEIDTGISGRTAQKVAEKILKISQSHQLICITHLPQIAAMADRHFMVEKDSDAESTQVHFNTLTDEQRAEELARMLSGACVTQTAKDNAKEMIAMSEALKKDDRSEHLTHIDI